MRSEGETNAEIRVGPAYWLPWVLVVLSILLLRARIGVPGAPALLPNGVDISLAVNARGGVWVSTAEHSRFHGPQDPGAPHPCIWRIDRWNRLRREVGSPFGGQDPDGSHVLDACLDEPYLLGFDDQGRLHFSDRGGLYRVESGGTIRRLGAGRRWHVVAADGSIYGTRRFQVIRRAPNGREEVVAGTGVRGYSLEGGPARHASLDEVAGVAIGADGSLYIADTGNLLVRRVDPGGAITTVAGTGLPGYGGDGGPATAAMLNAPTSVGVDSRGRVVIGDFRNYRLRRIETDGTIMTVAGRGVGGYSGNGGPATRAMLMCAGQPQPGPVGEVFFVDSSLGYEFPCIRKVDARGMIRAVAIPGGAR